ncbi:hypothetical protein [Ramlibacter rhizophilus]|uniref:DUF2946 domain-containing protein n=1 Tax=Ramlibacter rhizophilus TaxID=1781167 RepID=A0A4Z0C1A3_9BURK|nr:hypothetical protein [Ramlibacter rhizophilus]TFZ05001.1 hypothetical protein EZ242_04440 [Ramlibacter rhizophilus]
MSRCRLFLAWLLLLALPLQGLAAAGMQACIEAAQFATVAAAEVAAGSGHGKHHQAGPSQRDAQHDGHHAGHADAQHDDAHAHAAPDVPPPLLSLDAGHGCSLCAATCHGVAVATESRAEVLAAAPRVPAPEPQPWGEGRAPALPDKPPRA